MMRKPATTENKDEKGIGRSFFRPAVFVGSTLVIAILLSFLLFKHPQQFSRNILLVLVIWIPLLLLVNIPRLVRYWRHTLVFLVTAILSLAVLSASGSYVLKQRVLPHHNINLEHWPRPIPGMINEDGALPDRPAAAYRKEDFNILFLGDSFTYGFGLNDLKNAFPFQVERMLQERFPGKNIRVVNFGWINSSPVLQDRRFQKQGARYHPDLVVQVIDMTDFGDDLHFLKEIRQSQEAGRTEASIFKAMKVRFSMLFGLRDISAWLSAQWRWNQDKRNRFDAFGVENLRYYYPMRMPLSESSAYMEITWDEILNTRESANQMGARYALFILPRCQHYDPDHCPLDHVNFFGGQIPTGGSYLFEPFRYFEKKAESAGFPVHSLLDDFTKASTGGPLNLEKDDHYNEAGHRAAAEGIVRFLVEDGLVGGGSSH